MNIQHKYNSENSGRGEFFIEENGRTIAELDYEIDGDGVMDFYHTGVRPEYEGQGIAKELVLHGFDFARENSMKVIPTCSYVARLFERLPEQRDLLKDSGMFEGGNAPNTNPACGIRFNQ